MKEKKVKRFLAIALVMFLTTLSYVHTGATKHSIIDNPTYVNTMITEDTIKNDNVEVKTDSLRLQLIDAVESHIRKSFKIYDKNLPVYMVDHSLNYNIDLCFMMAQTTIETGFGTAGAGRPNSRHSLFGVCKRYGDYNSAVEDYCKLLRKSYLGGHKTEQDLMRNYVTLGGARYAANRRYERELSSEYQRIRNKTTIYELWTELKNS